MGSQNQLPQFSSLRKVHIIGVCGTLMGSFAAYLKRRGLIVTGSDQNVYPPMSDVLKNAGVVLYSGYRAENIMLDGQKPDLVVIGNVIRSDNPEARAAIEGGYPYSSLPEAMEKLLLTQTRNLVVAGTHGKTTTSSLLAHVLNECGTHPSYFIGGVSQDLPESFFLSTPSNQGFGSPLSGYFVLEGDEYDTAFWDKVPKFNHYLPNDVILTSIEYDHADIYPDLPAVVRAFEGLVTRIRPGGRLIACTDYPSVQKILPLAQVPVLTYSSTRSGGGRFTPSEVRIEQGMTRFRVLDKNQPVAELSLQLPGHHNVLNALSVWIECQALGLDMTRVAQALSSFRGVKRRQEVRGEIQGVLIIDDFAHHPTAVRETLHALRARYSGRRLLTVFEPRSATSRRKVFQQEYAQAFDSSDSIWISSPFDQSRIASDDLFSSETLVEDLLQRQKQAYLMSDVDQGVQEVARACRSGDVVAVLSNGGFQGFISKLMAALATQK